jgi:hypothetical protein
MNNDAPEIIKSEIEDAKQDLREALSEVNERVEEGLARVEGEIASFSPRNSIRRRPIAAACIAAALGATVGSKSYQSSIFGLALWGVAAALIIKSEPLND